MKRSRLAYLYEKHIPGSHVPPGIYIHFLCSKIRLAKTMPARTFRHILKMSEKSVLFPYVIFIQKLPEQLIKMMNGLSVSLMHQVTTRKRNLTMLLPRPKWLTAAYPNVPGLEEFQGLLSIQPNGTIVSTWPEKYCHWWQCRQRRSRGSGNWRQSPSLTVFSTPNWMMDGK